MQPAPAFSLTDHEGTMYRLDDYKGKWLVLYFYPKDDTPGCSAEACSFRDARDDLRDMGATIVGISKDPPNSHEQFMAKYKLNFTLLSDPEAAVMKAYGAWGRKLFGREGVLRKTFIINPEGAIAKTFGRVTPLAHGNQVVKALRQLQNA